LVIRCCEKNYHVCFFTSGASRDTIHNVEEATTNANKRQLFRKMDTGRATLSRYYMSCLSARSGLPACIYPCRYIPAFLLAVALAFAILGTISAPIYRSEIYAGSICAQRRDDKSMQLWICLRLL